MKILSIWMLLFTALSSATFAENRTIFFINGLGNDEATAHDHKLTVYAEYLDRVANPTDFIEEDDFSMELLHNPKIGPVSDVLEVFAQSVGWRQENDSFYDLYHRGILTEEMFQTYLENFVDTDAELTAITVSRISNRIEDAARLGPVVVIAHSQGTYFAETAYGFIDESVRGNLTLIYLGSPLESSSAGAHFVSLDCDVVVDGDQPDQIAGSHILPGFDCHGLRTYLLGTASYATREKIFSIMDAALNIPGKAKDIRSISFLQLAPPANLWEVWFGNKKLNFISQVDCTGGGSGGDVVPGLSALLSGDTYWNGRDYVTKDVYLLIEGDGLAEVPMAAWIHTCANMTVQPQVYEWLNDDSIGFRETVMSPPLRLARCEPQVGFSVGESEYQVKDRSGGDEVPFLCRGVVEFLTFGL